MSSEETEEESYNSSSRSSRNEENKASRSRSQFSSSRRGLVSTEEVPSEQDDDDDDDDDEDDGDDQDEEAPSARTSHVPTKAVKMPQQDSSSTDAVNSGTGLAGIDTSGRTLPRQTPPASYPPPASFIAPSVILPQPSVLGLSMATPLVHQGAAFFPLLSTGSENDGTMRALVSSMFSGQPPHQTSSNVQVLQQQQQQPQENTGSNEAALLLHFSGQPQQESRQTADRTTTTTTTTQSFPTANSTLPATTTTTTTTTYMPIFHPLLNQFITPGVVVGSSHPAMAGLGPGLATVQYATFPDFAHLAATTAGGPGTIAAGHAHLAVAPPPTDASRIFIIKGRTKRKYDHDSFPEKLHRLVREAVANGNGHIVRFSDDGTRFQIVNTSEFENDILPQYFRHRNINSFKRLLRMYGFRRVAGTWMQGTFEHPMFHRDSPDLAKHMERV